MEVEYVDRDRAAAVVIGTKDIVNDLKVKNGYKHSQPGLNFTNVLHSAFTHVDPKCTKKTVNSAVSSGAFGTYECKSCT